MGHEGAWERWPRVVPRECCDWQGVQGVPPHRSWQGKEDGGAAAEAWRWDGAMRAQSLVNRQASGQNPGCTLTCPTPAICLHGVSRVLILKLLERQVGISIQSQAGVGGPDLASPRWAGPGKAGPSTGGRGLLSTFTW